MKNKLKLILVFIAVFVVFGGVLYQGITRLEEDKYVKKIFSPTHQSMIFGTSKAEKLSGEYISTEMNKEGVSLGKMYNYAFNLGMSPYGPDYVRSIESKLDTNNHGVFIVCIDPWAVSGPEDSASFSEKETAMAFETQQRFSKIKYFFQYARKSYYTQFLPLKSEEESHNERPDKESIKKHLDAKMSAYRKMNFKGNISELRYGYFEELLMVLKKRGRVYLVRVPVSEEMIALEREYAPAFDERVFKTIEKYQLNWIDFYPIANQFLCPDGNHLFHEDADRVSKMIGNIINKNERGLLQGDSLNLLYLYLKN